MESEFEFLHVGDTVGIRSGTGASKKVYKLAQVERVTRTMVVVDRRKFYKDRGREVSGISWLEIMNAKEIEDWKKAKAKEEAEVEERRRNYDPRDHDDHVQAALRALRDKARTLCEKLQDHADIRLGHIEPKAPRWWPEFLALTDEIANSEVALKSVGLSTTLKSPAALRSLFQ
jgi:hypothetical protein